MSINTLHKLLKQFTNIIEKKYQYFACLCAEAMLFTRVD